MIGSPLQTPPADPREAAAWWSARRRLGLASIREDDAFETWLGEPANAAAWARVDGAIEDIGQLAALPELRAMREAALAVRPEHVATPLRRWIGLSALAASLAAGLLWIAIPDGGSDRTPIAQSQAATVQRYATRLGERRDILLADGSKVALNTASVLEVAYSVERRDIRLLSGQALFRVAKDADRPFVVAAGNRRITATGTAFDVRLNGGGSVSVLLVEGHVKVQPIQPSGLARLIPALATDALDPGQRLSVPVRGGSEIVTADIDRGTSWSRGQLIFRDDRISDALAEINRYSPVKIVAGDPSIANLKISGVFNADRQQNFLAAVTAFFPIETHRRSPGLIALKWRDDRGTKQN